MDPNATECYSVWIKARSPKRASGAVVANFIQDNIIYWFDIPKYLFSGR